MTDSPLAAVTVSIVAFNSRAVLEKGLSYLRPIPNLVIVDNASTDNTSAWLALALPQARVIRQQTNIGFGRGHNLAVSQCHTPYALLLNPDCQIASDDIAALIDCCRRHPDALMAAPLLVHADGSPQQNYRQFFHQKLPDLPAYQQPDGDVCVDMISGAVLMVDVAAFRALGGFDPWFFLYWEDEDLCIRARRQQMASILCCKATACHIPQTSSAPSARGTFIRHYSYTTSKLYLRRQLGESRLLLTLRALGTFAMAALALPLAALTGNRSKLIRSLARLVAVLTAAMQLHRARAVATPLQLLAPPPLVSAGQDRP